MTMQLHDIALKGILTQNARRPLRDQARPGILVPVNSSSSAFNALAYTLNVARALQSSIHIFHISDARELPDSGNPLVIGRMLDRMETKAANCVASLKEMIEESGVQVGRAESMVGNIERLLTNKVAELMPELIVLGKGSLPDSVIKIIVRRSGIPIVIVPDSAPTTLPESMMLSALGSPFCQSNMNIINKFVHCFSPSVTTVSYPHDPARKDAHTSIKHHLNRGLRGRIEEMQVAKTVNRQELADFIRVHKFDLVCIARNQRPFWKRLFTTDGLRELPFQLDVPTMVL